MKMKPKQLHRSLALPLNKDAPSKPSMLLADRHFFFLLERHLAQVAWSLNVLNLICIPQSTHALDQGGVEPRQAVSPRPGGQGRYRFATASVASGGQALTVALLYLCFVGEGGNLHPRARPS